MLHERNITSDVVLNKEAMEDNWLLILLMIVQPEWVKLIYHLIERQGQCPVNTCNEKKKQCSCKHGSNLTAGAKWILQNHNKLLSMTYIMYTVHTSPTRMHRYNDLDHRKCIHKWWPRNYSFVYRLIILTTPGLHEQNSKEFLL